MLVIAGYVLGAGDPWDMDDDELAEARGLLADRIGLIRGFWSRSDELARQVATGDVVVAYAWNDAFLAARRAGAPVAFLARLEEGAIVWTEGFVLAAATRNFFTAHRYVDAWLAPETARRLTSGTAMGHVTFEVGDGVEAEVRDALRLDDPAAVTGAGVHLDRNIPRRRVYDEAWTAVKRGERSIFATEPVA
jgi:spermidine/putrescine transport system substrate-binding protein